MNFKIQYSVKFCKRVSDDLATVLSYQFLA